MNLYDYQLTYLENLPKNCIMAADVGLGKTIMALEHARRHGLKRLVVIAPASKVRTNDWQREIHNYLDAYDDNMERSFAPFEVLSYEMFTKRADEFLSPNVTLIIDESHMACNATTKRAKAILKVARQAKQWIMLSATPLPNGWQSAVTYAMLTGLARNKTDFYQRFVIMTRIHTFFKVTGYRDMATLERWWAQIARPLKRTGAQHLPSQMIAVEPPMPTRTLHLYNQAKVNRTYQDELLDNPSKLFTTLRQIPTPARVDALQSIVESTDEHVVVFYNYNSEREAMYEMLHHSFKGREIYEQSGHTSKLPKRDDWQTLKPSVTLVQYQSGSQAIELTYASVTVYLSPPTSFANYEQSKGRTRRNGQEKLTLFYHIAVGGSLDRHIWQIIGTKRDFSLRMFEKSLDL